MKAEFSQSRNDLFWSVWDHRDGRMTWIGYNDDNWWTNVARRDAFRIQRGKASKCYYILDASASTVERVSYQAMTARQRKS